MSDRTRVEVAQSDIFTPQGIFESATRILSAFITSKQFSDKQEQAFLDKSVFLAFAARAAVVSSPCRLIAGARLLE
jgi:hypothetical protein